MNAERLHIILNAVKSDLSATNAPTLLATLAAALQNQVSQPQQPQHQQQVSTSYKDLSNALSKSEFNSFSPSWIQVLQELGFDGLLGNQLSERISEIFNQNQITPNIAHEELQKINKKLSKKVQAIDNIISGFKSLDVGAEELKKGDCEIGVLVPRAYLESKLDNFGKELVELNKILNPFAELATGTRDGFKVRNISSSDFMIAIVAIPPIAASVAYAIERILIAYEKLLDIKIKHAELRKLGLEEKELSGIDEHANRLMEKEIDKLAPELIKNFHTIDDKGRKNELEIELKLSLNKIANRVDKGFNIEVRAEQLDEPEIVEGNEEGKESENSEISIARKHILTIQEASKNIKFFEYKGDSILCLPEKTEKPKKP